MKPALKKKEDSEDIILVYPDGNIRVFERTESGSFKSPRVCTICFLRQRTVHTY